MKKKRRKSVSIVRTTMIDKEAIGREEVEERSIEERNENGKMKRKKKSNI